MTASETARLATNVFFTDLHERKGFRELMDRIPDWPKIQSVMVDKVERELIAAQEAEIARNTKQLEIVDAPADSEGF